MTSGYISGQWNNFEKRLHQFCSGVDSLALFKLEGQLYTGINAIQYVNITGGILNTGYASLSLNTKIHWDDQFNQKAQLYNFPTGNVFH